ncbi:hypothetical protein [Gloeothece verrucosa]|uniref:Uncharacterized protein n=1 Tax=Gloeothece verrucosa (strain PCC 7822) TaxID=497965 RepID=E0UDB1_GLOV7|nr:hypothetical protein [Gloeothece verrucosa]ADN14102.1 conserved hypothetical protein [Gloeothece verrucosa PCC 7822]
MRRRQHRTLSLPTQNLDSFLDILTNTVGVLMFISLFITLVSVQGGKIIHTPLVAKTNKKPHFFEVNKNRVIFIDDEEVQHQLGLLTKSLPSCPHPKLPDTSDASAYQTYTERLQDYEQCKLKSVEKIKNFQVTTNSYNVRLYDLNALLYEPLNEKVGETVEQFTEPNSEFESVLQKLNPKQDYLAFIVRQDSFSAFRLAREKAIKKGFDVGWEPHNSDNPIVFGSKGREIGVQ